MDKKKIPAICKMLSEHVANSFVLYVKTLNFHWNMKSPQFFMYHKLLQDQYEHLQESIDDLAERVRILQHTPPSSLAEFLELASLKEAKSTLKDQAMIKALVQDREAMVEACLAGIELCQTAGDEGTADLLIQQLRDHDKQAWLLRSHL